MLNRYDHVKYDEIALTDQLIFKTIFKALSDKVDASIGSPRVKALVHTKLEEAYMWIGKGIRDDQIFRSEPSEPNKTKGEQL